MSSLTKNTIAAVFLDLTSQKPIDKITVKDIVEKCQITRQTFYYHFQDLMDVIEWSLDQKMEEVLAKSLQAETVQEAIRIQLSVVEEYPEIVNKLMNSRKRDMAERLLFNTMRTYLQKMIDEKGLFMDMRRSDLELALDFYSHAMLGIVVDICQKRQPVDLDKLSDRLYQLITGKMFLEEESWPS